MAKGILYFRAKPMYLRIQPLSRPLHATCALAGAKSETQRAYALALLNEGQTTVIHTPSHSEDDTHALGILAQFGATFTESELKTSIHSAGVCLKSSFLDAGESGLAARLFAPIAALGDTPFTLRGRGTLLRRPFPAFAEFLPHLGVQVRSNEGFLPIHFEGPLQAKNLHINAHNSSQYLSGLLFALSAVPKQKDLHLYVDALVSRPYIDLTLDVLAKGHAFISHTDYSHFSIPAATKIHCPDLSLRIEGDWSAAAFFLVMGTLYGQVVLRNLNLHSKQGDRKIRTICEEVGASIIEIGTDTLQVKAAVPPRAFDYDASDTPDLFPPLLALACGCQGTSRIHGLHRLVSKESDRSQSLREEFKKIGAHMHREKDTLCITGTPLHGNYVDSHEDHRVAMALAVAALGAKGPTHIKNPTCVRKSYPNFWNTLQHMGVVMERLL